MKTIRHVTDWSRFPEPWATIGPDLAAAVRVGSLTPVRHKTTVSAATRSKISEAQKRIWSDPARRDARIAARNPELLHLSGQERADYRTFRKNGYSMREALAACREPRDRSG